MTERLGRAAADVDSMLDRAAPHCLADIEPVHYARLTGWQMSQRPGEPGAVGRYDGPLAFLNPARHHVEIGRIHAEALLVSETLGDTIVSSAERETLTCRALGILPEDETGRLLDIISCPQLSPRKTAQSASVLVQAVDDVASAYGWATALTYGQLVAGGLRTPEEFSKYGERIDRLFKQVVAAPAVAQWLVPPWPVTPEEKHEHLYGLLWHARDTLWRMRPNRVWTPFLLTQVVDGYLEGENGVGNSLGLTLIDSIIISRLGFRPGVLATDGVLSIEVPILNRTAYWDVSRAGPLSFERPFGSQRVDTAGLFALTHASLAAMHAGGGRLERALDAFARALELKPDSTDIRTSRAVCYLRNEMPAEAVKELKAVLAAVPECAEVWHQLGNAYTVMSNWPRALDAYRRAVKLKPDGTEVYNNMGIAYLRAGDTGQAVAAFEAALEVEANYYQAHFNLGNIHLEKCEHDRAIQHYREAVRIAPAFVPAHYNMGQACYNKGDLDGAIRSYQKALDLNPKHFGAWHNLGIAYRDKGMTSKAVEALEKAVAINPNLMR